MLGRKVIYVRCIKCSYNNVAKGICLLDKKHFCLYRKKFMQVRAFERYIPLMFTQFCTLSDIKIDNHSNARVVKFGNGCPTYAAKMAF